MNKKWILGLGMAAMMMGMTPSAYASGKYWYCYDYGEDFSDVNNTKPVTYYSTVFYMGYNERPNSSDFGHTIHYKNFLSKVHACNHYDDKRSAKHARSNSIDDDVNRDIEVRYTNYDG